MTVSFLRHDGWVGPSDFQEPINIIGVGATGSHIALALAKMGVTKFKLWDHDHVESHNLPNQVYEPEHLGLPKVEALKKVLQRFNPEVQVEANERYFTTAEDAKSVTGPLVLTVDSMKARKDIHNTFKGNIEIPMVIETRLGFDAGDLFVLNPLDYDECAQWFATLKNDEDIPEGPCNLRICTTLVGIVSSTAAHAICSYYAAERAGNEWRFKYRTIFNLSPSLSVYTMDKVKQKVVDTTIQQGAMQ